MSDRCPDCDAYVHLIGHPGSTVEHGLCANGHRCARVAGELEWRTQNAAGPGLGEPTA